LVTLADTLAGKLTPASDNAEQVETGIDRPKKIGLTIAFLVFGVFGLWAALAPIDGAAHAPGIIRAKSYNKIVQHLEGGIVKEIKVQNGDFVNAGDVILVMDSTQSQAQFEIYSGLLLTTSTLEARLIAERDGLISVTYPAILLSAGTSGQIEMDAQNHVFMTRKAAREGSKAVLQQRIGQLRSRVTGLKALLTSKTSLANSYKEELSDFLTLLEEGFTDKQRLRELERNHTQLIGEAADLTATIASTEIQIGETELQILQENYQFQNEVANQLAEVQAKLKDTKERLTAITDVFSRSEVEAPISGLLTNLLVHTEGAVLSPGLQIAEIVPQSDELIIEATVQPNDIDRVEEGQSATVRLSAFNSRTIPILYGTVLSLSADTMKDQNSGATYYLARIEISPESMTELRDLVLIPGMPAEVLITTGSRTFLQYVMKPLSNAAARSFIED